MQTSGKIRYRDHYKYQMDEEWWVDTPITNAACELPRFIALEASGRLTVRAGYAWDGPSGPTSDTKDFMRGSLAHDALYQLMREGLLAQKWRKAADRLLHDLCRQDGMSWFRAWYVLKAVREFAASAAKRQSADILTAP